MKKNYQKDMASKIESNPKVFWRYINSNRKNKDGIAPLSTDNINFETNNKNKADMLNNFFSSVFTVEDLNNIPDTTPGEKSNNCFISDIIVTEHAVRDKLLKLKINKSPGPDKLFPLLLFILSEELALPITILFNKSLETGVLPSAWKHAEVTPIFKKGSKVSPNNYRPVSLTSILCKTLESFVRDSIQEHMESLNLYTDCQHGFRTGRSCVSQLLEVFNDFSKFSDSNDPFDVIYLDFAKAFDTVPHERLLRKMSAYGIGGNILKWTRAFLSDRTQQVRVKNDYSKISKVTSGIPQGSILGPILFTIFINDLPESISTICKIFADDTKIYDYCYHKNNIQKDLYTLQDWTEKWQLYFNNDKCKCLHYGRNNPNHDYNFLTNNRPNIIQDSNSEKDLGVTFDLNLNFDLHINDITKKANQVLGLIKRNFKYMDNKTFILLYKSLVRPILEYGAPIWSPHLLRQSRLIEDIQRRATKLLPEMAHLSYEERLQKLQLPSLKFRRLRGDLIQLYNMVHDEDSFNFNKFFTFAKNQGTRGHNFKLYIHPCNKNVRKYSFSFRCTNIWNNLSNPTVNAFNVDHFKKLLDWDLSDKIFNYDLRGY